MTDKLAWSTFFDSEYGNNTCIEYIMTVQQNWTMKTATHKVEGAKCREKKIADSLAYGRRIKIGSQCRDYVQHKSALLEFKFIGAFGTTPS